MQRWLKIEKNGLQQQPAEPRGKGEREIAADRVHKPTTTGMEHAGKASIKSDTFVITVVPNVDSIMLGALFLSSSSFAVVVVEYKTRETKKMKKWENLLQFISRISWISVQSPSDDVVDLCL